MFFYSIEKEELARRGEEGASSRGGGGGDGGGCGGGGGDVCSGGNGPDAPVTRSHVALLFTRVSLVSHRFCLVTLAVVASRRTTHWR